MQAVVRFIVNDGSFFKPFVIVGIRNVNKFDHSRLFIDLHSPGADHMAVVLVLFMVGKEKGYASAPVEI